MDNDDDFDFAEYEKTVKEAPLYAILINKSVQLPSKTRNRTTKIRRFLFDLNIISYICKYINNLRLC